MKHFLANEHHRAMAIKRGEGRRLIPFDELVSHDGAELEPADNLTPDRIYERRWALTVFEKVLERLGEEYLAAGNARLFDRFKELLADEPDHLLQAEIAAELGMTENAVKQAFHRISSALSRIVARGDRPHGRGSRRHRGRLRHLIAVLRE